MIVQSIGNPNLISILDERDHTTYYGCNQAWYATDWQRRAGCGPSAACNIVCYLTRLGKLFHSKEKWIAMMEESWKYVTPTKRGIPTTNLFCDSMLSYTKSKGMNVEYERLDLPEDQRHRPSLQEVVGFIARALCKDAPVAFLNLCNGKETNLDAWHWVTIISLTYAEDGSQVFINVLDEGLIKKIDLALWYKTTTLGGGFVYFANKASYRYSANIGC